MINEKELDDLCAKVRRLTDRNHHNDARLLIAKTLLPQGNDHVEHFKWLKHLHRSFGYMPDELIALRNRITKVMFCEIEAVHGSAQTNNLHQCL